MKITNEDNMALMARYEDNHFDLAIVDPPYGIKIDGQKESIKGKKSDRKGHTKKEWDREIPPLEYFEELKRVSKNQIIWGANYFVEHLNEAHKGWIVWDKGQHGLTMSDCELAYSSFDCATRVKVMNRAELSRHGGSIHPTQKPVRLYTWLLTNYAKEGDLILDTHVGSASSIVACNQLGFDVVGCELDEEYYQLASKRIEEETAQLKLF